MDLENLWEQIGLLGRDPICAFELDFRLIAFNQAHNDEFFRVNGFYTKIGDVFCDLFIEKQRPVMRSLMARALTGEPFTVVEEFGSLSSVPRNGRSPTTPCATATATSWALSIARAI